MKLRIKKKLLKNSEGLITKITNMTKEEKNKAIAEILGFKQYGITVNGKKDAVMAWEYPKEYRHLVSTSPMYDCPDFIKQIEDVRQIKKVLQGWEI